VGGALPPTSTLGSSSRSRDPQRTEDRAHPAALSVGAIAEGDREVIARLLAEPLEIGAARRSARGTGRPRGPCDARCGWTSCRNGRAIGGAQYGSPTSGPAVASSSAALSRTLHVTAWPIDAPLQPSPASGPAGLRARVGLSPKRPHAEAGMRIEPPPSVAC